MQPTPVDAVLFPDRPVVRLSGELRGMLEALSAQDEVYEDTVGRRECWIVLATSKDASLTLVS